MSAPLPGRRRGPWVALGLLALAVPALASIPTVEAPGRQHWTLIRQSWPGEDAVSRSYRRLEAVHVAARARLQQSLLRLDGEILLSARAGGEARFLEERLTEMGPPTCRPPRGAPREVLLERVRVEFLDRAPDRRAQLGHLIRLVEQEILRLAAAPAPGERLGVFRVLLGDLRRLQGHLEAGEALPACAPETSADGP